MSQLRFPAMAGGANTLALIDAQRAFQGSGASDPRFLDRVREPTSQDARDTEWRPIDSNRDNVETAEPGVDYVASYPRDATVLYYWRPTYWRRRQITSP